jgi:Uma2 family endonuclease
VSEGAANRRRDLETKPDEYRRARISEYWIVDPQAETIIVFTNAEAAVSTQHEYRREESALSEILSGFSVSVDEVLSAASSR